MHLLVPYPVKLPTPTPLQSCQLSCPTTHFTAAPTNSPPLMPTPMYLSQQRHTDHMATIATPFCIPFFFRRMFFCFMRSSLARYLLNTLPLRMLSSQPPLSLPPFPFLVLASKRHTRECCRIPRDVGICDCPPKCILCNNGHHARDPKCPSMRNLPSPALTTGPSNLPGHPGRITRQTARRALAV